MSKILSITAALICLCAFAAAAFTPLKTDGIFGKIVSIDAAAHQLVMTVSMGGQSKNLTVAVTAETRIGKAGTPITLTDLAVGDKIRVRLNDDNKTASSILVITAKKTKVLTAAAALPAS